MRSQMVSLSGLLDLQRVVRHLVDDNRILSHPDVILEYRIGPKDKLEKSRRL